MKVLASLIALTLPDAKPAQITPVLYMASLYAKSIAVMSKTMLVNYKHNLATYLVEANPFHKLPCGCGC